MDHSGSYTLTNWRGRIVSPEKALAAIKPGISIFISTGMAEPRTFVKHLMASEGSNLQDMEIIQLMSPGGVKLRQFPVEWTTNVR